MKKIKLMILSVLVVASVGAALAFKAAKGQALFCGTTQPPSNNCPIPTNVYGIGNGVPISNIWCSTVLNGVCRTVIAE